MAAPGFGFSAGDFISGISLVKKLIQALNDTVGSRASYRQLIAELRNLDQALGQIRCLPVNETQPSQREALLRISGQCQFSIEKFLNNNAKFKESLGLEPSASAWRTNLNKIQWALCKDGAIDELRIQIGAHTTTLNLVLGSIQLSATQCQGEAVDSCRQLIKSVESDTREGLDLAKQNRQLLIMQADLVQRLSSTLAGLSTEDRVSELQLHFQTVLESISKTLSEVVKIQQLSSNIPPQIKRQQPVIFEDAHERQFPFHIEFINSFSAFQQLLELRFEDVPGLRKVKSLEYVMQDVASKRAIDLSSPWETICRPGRKVLMSMVFQSPKTSTSSCPGCLTEAPDHPDSGGSDTLCANPDCGISFRRVTEVETIGPGKRRLEEEAQQALAKRRKTTQATRKSREASNGNDVEEISEDEIHEFRRVQIVHKVSASAPRAPPCKTPSTHQLLPITRTQSQVLSSKRPVNNSLSRKGVMPSDDVRSTLPTTEKQDEAQLNHRDARFRSIFARRQPFHARPGPSIELQKETALSLNMSIDTDREGQRSASYADKPEGARKFDKASIFARVGWSRTSSNMSIDTEHGNQQSASHPDSIEIAREFDKASIFAKAGRSKTSFREPRALAQQEFFSQPNMSTWEDRTGSPGSSFQEPCALSHQESFSQPAMGIFGNWDQDVYGKSFYRVP